MRAITLHQPWATLVACGHKRVETRSWPTSYRGQIAIHAAKVIPPYAQEILDDDEHIAFCLEESGIKPKDLPLGKIVAHGLLTNCLLMTADLVDRCEIERPKEFDLGDWSVGRYAWILSDVQRIWPPIPWKGAQGLWIYDGPLDIRDLDVPRHSR
jgi:hypothetical protein